MISDEDSQMSLEKTKRKRATFKSAATKLINRISEMMESDNVEINVLEELRDQLIEKESQISILNEKIEDLIQDLDTLDSEIEISTEYHDRIFSIKFKVNKLLQNLKKDVETIQMKNTDKIESVNETSIERINRVKKANVRLPKLSIQLFDGSLENWQEFWGNFEQAIHQNDELTNTDKFSYLKSFLKSSALVAIQGLVISDSNYDIAIDILKRRFGKREIIIRAHLDKLMNLEPVKSASNLKELRELADICSVQIRCLDSIGVKLDTFGSLLFPILLKLIPDEIVLEFHRNRSEDESWNVNELLEFLNEEINNREKTFLFSKRYQKEPKFQYENKFVPKYKFTYDKKPSYSTAGTRNIPTAATLTAALKTNCLFCESKEHETDKCEEFSLEEKKNSLKRQGRCFRCLKRFHLASDCKVKINPCELCQSKRHTKLFCNNSSKKPGLQAKEIPENKTIVSSVSQCEIPNSKNEVILQTSPVTANSGFKSAVKICLMDSGSERTFITKALAAELELKSLRKEKLLVYSFGTRIPEEKIYDVVRLKLKNCEKPKRYIRVDALVSDIISGTALRASSQNIEELIRRRNVWQTFSVNTRSIGEIDILIGMDYFCLVNCGRVEKLSRNIFASDTIFGWTIQGKISVEKQPHTSVMRVSVNSVDEATNRDINCLWQLDALGICNEYDKPELDSHILKQFNDDLRFVNGRYETKLIWKSDEIELGNNWQIAKRRFTDLKHRLKNDAWLLENYTKIIKEQYDENIVEDCCNENFETEYYMPHKPVVRKDKSTTKVRMVFDASSKGNNTNSLNECLLPGPNLNPNILTIILKFREHKIVFSSDIEKAFLMINVKNEDRRFLKFFWFNDEAQQDSKCWKILRMTRIPFGATCSPFILAATIKHHIKKYETTNPDAYNMLNDALYVDDLYYGAGSNEQALQLTLDAVNILKDAGMNLRKFTTNSEKLRKLWAENKIPENEAGAENSFKVLGIIWDPNEDIFKIELKAILEVFGKMKYTKRFVLQIAAMVFDPVGFIAPFVIRIKNIMQEIWMLGLDWDDEVPEDIKQKFLEWCFEIKEINHLSISRNYFNGYVTEKTIHIFCDASPRAYGAVAYFRYLNKENISTSFIMSKARVSPLKKLTLPRLELMGAVVAARLAGYLKTVFKLTSEDITLWTDSSIVFHWIRGAARDWKPFVSNRVIEIQSFTAPQKWKHCKSEDNSADLLTRGEKVNSIITNALWWQGPPWLRKSENEWPQKFVNKESEEDITAERKLKIDTTVQFTNMTRIPSTILNIDNFSKLSRVVRITAWVRRFIHNCKPGEKNVSVELSESEIAEAEKHWIKVVQNEAFSEEINQLRSGKHIDKQSRLYQLCPEFDDDELLCLKGRLQFSNFEDREKHPWILPRNKFTELLVLEAHNKVFHSGIESTLTEIREKFWIIKGRQFIKSVLKKCLICRRFNARPGIQIVAPLPPDRIMESPPFSVTGIDFLGPVFSKGTSEKHYILLCTCAVTRAIHLEIVSNLSTEMFLLALRRFIARRGLCSTIYSDNAKTFKRANLELTQMWEVLNDPEVKAFYGSRGIKWKFIAERAAWWGGFWERMVRIIKCCFRKVVGKTSLSLEELETVMIEIEATINSRPITFVYSDPQEPSPLTPAHFLVGRRLISLPSIKLKDERILINRDMLIKRFNYREKILQQFWQRWHKEYILNLRSANAMTPIKETYTFKVNDVVLINDDKLPRNMWRLGKIIDVFPGRDGNVRSCSVKTKTATLRRPIQLLCPLELNEL